MHVKVNGYIENLANYFLDYSNDCVLKWSISGIYSQLLIKNFWRVYRLFYESKNKQNVTQESKIEITAEIIDQINKMLIYSRLKGRALSMLVSSKKY